MHLRNRAARAWARGLVVVVVGFGLATQLAPAAVAAAFVALPVSAHLDPVRPALEQIVEQAARDGLPSELIVGKVREGLAKEAPPDAIRVAAERLARSLSDASRFVQARQKTGPDAAALVRALAEARHAGVELEVMAPLCDAGAHDAALVRAVEALTELTVRGYPSRRAAALVGQVLARNPGSMGRVVAGVEAIRLSQAVSRVDALDALGRSLASERGQRAKGAKGASGSEGSKGSD